MIGRDGDRDPPVASDPRTPRLLLASALLFAQLAWSGVAPFDRTTWWLEIAPIPIAWIAMLTSHRRFPLTTLLYGLAFGHACVLMLGGAYSYARVPIGFEVAELLGLDRNPYDKLGHFLQGFVPAIAAREILIRGRFVSGRRMLAFVVVSIALAISAAYELVEWAAALALGQGADEFLGTQGDPWDTQSDMFMALLGAVSALLTLSRLHDRQIAARERGRAPQAEND